MSIAIAAAAYDLNTTDAGWLHRLRCGAAIVITGGLATSAAIGAQFAAVIGAPKPIPRGYLPAMLTAAAVGLGIVIIAAGAWLFTTPPPMEADEDSARLRRFSRAMWLVPLLLAGLGWGYGASAPVFIIAAVSSVLVPCGRLIMLTGALLVRAKREGWARIALLIGSTAGFYGVTFVLMFLGPLILGGIAKNTPGLAGLLPAAGAAAPPAPSNDPFGLMVFMEVAGPVFLAAMGCILWAPVARLWYELRRIEQRRHASAELPADRSRPGR